MSVIRGAIVAMLLLCAPAGAIEFPLLEGSIEPINVIPDFTAELQADFTQWSHKEERLGAKYVRLHFTEITDQSAIDYKIIIRDRNNRPIQTLTKDEFRTKSEFWTKVIDGDYALVEVVAAMRPTGLRFKLGEIAFQKNMGASFSIVLPDDREPIVTYRKSPQIFSRSRAVAKLTFIVGGGTAMCTGFLIAEDQMLTNEHCINTAKLCDTAVAIFGYEVNENGQLNLGEQYPCIELIKSDEKLDYAHIRLAGKPGAVWGKLELTRRAPIANEQTYLIQHPAGEPKQISRKDCSVTTVAANGNIEGSDIGHKCDTLQGASGSPVLGSDFKVVGLHHFGFDSSDPRWRGENRAVHMKRVMDHAGLP